MSKAIAGEMAVLGKIAELRQREREIEEGIAEVRRQIEAVQTAWRLLRAMKGGIE